MHSTKLWIWIVSFDILKLRKWNIVEHVYFTLQGQELEDSD